MEIVLPLRYYVTLPEENRGSRIERIAVSNRGVALLLLNAHGWKLENDSPERQRHVNRYGEPEVQLRETVLERYMVPALEIARAAGVPVVFASDSSSEAGAPDFRASVPRSQWDFAAPVAPAHGDYLVGKTVYSAFFATWLDLLLRNLGVTTLVIAGFNGESDLLFTGIDAAARGYRVVVLRDGYRGVAVPAYEPAVDITTRLEHYAETRIGYTIGLEEFRVSCREARVAV